MAIIGKLGSAMTGFWWALDEHERMQLLLAAAMALSAAASLLGDRRKSFERERLVEELADELERRRGAPA